MARTRRDTWAKRVARWQASGLTAKQFAAKIGVNPRTLSHWKWVLAKDERGASSGRRGRTKRAPVSFTEVVIEPAMTGAATIEIVLRGGQVVRVGSLVDEETLRRVLDVLEARS